MNTARAIMWTGMLGTAAGVTYAVHRYWRNGSNNGTDSTSIAPLPICNHPRRHVRINRSKVINGDVVQSPEELLAQAREFIPEITLEVLTGARLAASEHDSGTETEHACIIDSELNRAEQNGRSLVDSLTRGAGFGKQGRKKRPATTARDPAMRHALTSQIVCSGKARGISNGATRFYDPYILNRQHAKFRQWDDNGRVGPKPAIVSCDALTLLEAWSFDYGKKSGNRCPPDRSRPGRHPLAWVGAIEGVDPLRLFLMRPMPHGAEHQRIYEAAREVLSAGLKVRSA